MSLTYPGTRHVPFPSLDSAAAARSIALVSASKAWNLAGLKAALAVPGSDAHTVTASIHDEVEESAGLFGVLASEAAFDHGEPWLDHLITTLDHNRRLLATLLDRQLPDIRHHPPQAGYVAWLNCRALALPDDPAQFFLDHGRVGLSSGLRFGPADDPDHAASGFVRLNFATSPDLVTEAIRRMTIR